MLNNNLTSLRVRDWQLGSRSGSNRMAVLLVMQFCMLLLLVHLARTDTQILATGIFAFTYTFTLTYRLFDINTLIRQIEDSFLQATPMTQMLFEDIEIKDHPEAKQLIADKGEIDLNHITFAYKEKDTKQSVFRDFNLIISAGEKVGLVGPSGGGKSTLTRLLLRFDDLQQGQILIDNQDIAAVTQDSLRKSIAYVPQEPLLFHRTIRENIAYGNPDASEREIVAAAKKG